MFCVVRKFVIDLLWLVTEPGYRDEAGQATGVELARDMRRTCGLLERVSRSWGMDPAPLVDMVANLSDNVWYKSKRARDKGWRYPSPCKRAAICLEDCKPRPIIVVGSAAKRRRRKASRMATVKGRLAPERP